MGLKTKPLRFSFLYLIIVISALSLVLSACSSGPQTPAPAQPANDAPAAAPETTSPAETSDAPTASIVGGEVSGNEIMFTLKENEFPEEIRVKAGSTVVFVVQNLGKEKHDFEFPDFEFQNEVEPRETVRIEWTVPDMKGTWDMGCYLTEPEGVHDDMEGLLIIE